MTMRWSFNKTLVRQGAYLLSDADGTEIAAIVAADDSLPIHVPEPNAKLLIRDCDSNDWQSAGRFTFAEAVNRGNAHAECCRAQCDPVSSMVPKREP